MCLCNVVCHCGIEMVGLNVRTVCWRVPAKVLANYDNWSNGKWDSFRLHSPEAILSYKFTESWMEKQIHTKKHTHTILYIQRQ